MSFLLNLSLRYQLRNNHYECFKFFRNYPVFRILSSNNTSKFEVKENSEEIKTKAYQEIYRFPNIRYGYAINKFKWTQTLVTALALPTSAAMYFGGFIDSNFFGAVSFLGIVLCVNLYAYGTLFNKAIGFMYLREDGTTLKISYLDFWGARINKEVAVEDVVPFTDAPKLPTDGLYRTLQFYSTDGLKLKLFLKYGGKVTDTVRFISVFGDDTKYQ